jgi:hypothetical protein
MGEIKKPIQKYCIYKFNPEELTILRYIENEFLHTIVTQTTVSVCEKRTCYWRRFFKCCSNKHPRPVKQTDIPWFLMKKEERNSYATGIPQMDKSEFDRYKTLLQKKEYRIRNVNFYLSTTLLNLAGCAVCVFVYLYIPIPRVFLILAIFGFSVENKKKSFWRTIEHLKKFVGLIGVIRDFIPNGLCYFLFCAENFNHYWTEEWVGMSIISCLGYRCSHYTPPVYFIVSRVHAFCVCLSDLKLSLSEIANYPGHDLIVDEDLKKEIQEMSKRHDWGSTCNRVMMNGLFKAIVTYYSLFDSTEYTRFLIFLLVCGDLKSILDVMIEGAIIYCYLMYLTK